MLIEDAIENSLCKVAIFFSVAMTEDLLMSTSDETNSFVVI